MVKLPSMDERPAASHQTLIIARPMGRRGERLSDNRIDERMFQCKILEYLRPFFARQKL